jgi:hypothetical protein
MPGTWQPLNNQPSFNASTMLLLTDGTVMCNDEGSGFAGSPHWWKLTPDASGNYINGTWTQLADGPNSPLYFASAVLRDGRVFVAGGEYNGSATVVDLLAAEIYDPSTNTWTSLPTPAGWTNIGDAPCCVLPNGRVLIGSILNGNTAIYDPVSNTWTAAANKNNGRSEEETWTLLPDQTILVEDCLGHPQTEKYIIAADGWMNIGQTPSDLVEAASLEIGPALLLPDGRVFAIGATGNTTLYTMAPIASQSGTWANGPSFPQVNAGQTLGSKDAPACLLPNGKVLCVAGPVDGVSGDYLTPTYFFEFDPASLSFTTISNPPNNGSAPFNGRMMLLPTGQVLFANGSNDIEVYTPDLAPDPAWKPQILSVSSILQPNHFYTLTGRQLNGLSQAVSYGDDAAMATNYPLVQICNLGTGAITYCRTLDHSTMGVATGVTTQSTTFHVPAGLPGGSYALRVIANGIASDPVTVMLQSKGLKEHKEKEKDFKEKEKDFKEKEFDGSVKVAFDQKGKEMEGGGSAGPASEPEWMRIIRILAERSDKVEALLAQQRAFIREEERPVVGEQALSDGEDGQV